MIKAAYLTIVIALAALPQGGYCQKPEAPPASPAGKPTAPPSPAAAAEDLKLPGLVVNRKEHCVDIDATVCLKEGSLELIACTKEHEVLCLPEVHSSDNGALQWQIDPTHLPAVQTKVILRLRPQTVPAKKVGTQTPADQP